MAKRSRVRGDFKLRRTLRAIHQTLDNELRPAMQQAAQIVLDTQQQLIPKDTGAGAAALTAFVSQSGLDAQIGIRGKKDNRRFYYLRFVEYGTKGYSGKVSGKRDPANKSDGATFFGYSPEIPAQPAHPWLRPSYDLNRDEIVRLIRSAIDSTLRKASRGGA